MTRFILGAASTIWILALLLLLLLTLANPGFSHAQTIPRARVREIQRAMHRPATGKMDAETYFALKSLAQERGWQTRKVPDARVLDLLGLGARHNRTAESTHNDPPVEEAKR